MSTPERKAPSRWRFSVKKVLPVPLEGVHVEVQVDAVDGDVAAVAPGELSRPATLCLTGSSVASIS
jgi:hypothetical protein